MICLGLAVEIHRLNFHTCSVVSWGTILKGISEFLALSLLAHASCTFPRGLAQHHNVAIQSFQPVPPPGRITSPSNLTCPSLLVSSGNDFHSDSCRYTWCLDSWLFTNLRASARHPGCWDSLWWAKYSLARRKKPRGHTHSCQSKQHWPFQAIPVTSWLVAQRTSHSTTLYSLGPGDSWNLLTHHCSHRSHCMPSHCKEIQSLWTKATRRRANELVLTFVNKNNFITIYNHSELPDPTSTWPDLSSPCTAFPHFMGQQNLLVWHDVYIMHLYKFPALENITWNKWGEPVLWKSLKDDQCPAVITHPIT